MARRIAAGIIAGAALVHIVLLFLVLFLGDGHSPPLLLVAAFFLALAAFLCSVWVLVVDPGREARILSSFMLHCRVCTHPADPDCGFCTRCGESAPGQGA